jgi:hypothetical protein
MNVLIKTASPFVAAEVKDSYGGSDTQIFYAVNTEHAIVILNENKINKVILEIASIDEVNLLGHINKYYKNTETLIITNSRFSELFKIIKGSNFSVYKEPLNLNGLHNFINKCELNI